MDVRVLMPLVAGKASGNQALFDAAHSRNMTGAAVQERSASLFRREHLIPAGIVNNAGDSLALVFQRNRDAKYRVTVSEVGGAIQRVNIPAEVASGFATA